MRLIGTIQTEQNARRFTSFLKAKGIESNCEVSFDTQTHHLLYQIWIRDEDQIIEAKEALQRFDQNPADSEFQLQAPPPPPPSTYQINPNEAGAATAKAEALPQRGAAIVTQFFLALCVFIYFLDWVQSQEIVSVKSGQENVLLTPIKETLLFDLPVQIDELGKEVNPSDPLLQKGFAEEKELESMTYWHGAYDWFLDKLRGNNTNKDLGPLFYKIGQGELWRLFTPVLLHGGFLHILFNMIWLWVLGIPIEQRLRFFKTLLLTLLLGVGSNVCQYLMGGPFFIGYSGIAVGLAGFIWSREKVAPWEGYPLQKTTIWFLLLFVIGVFVVQLVAFGMEYFAQISFSPNIANTGHISGGLIGMLLGRLPFFARGPK